MAPQRQALPKKRSSDDPLKGLAMKRVSLVVTLAPAAGLSAQAASAYSWVSHDKGNWTGLDVDICRAIAAAIFNDPSKVKFVPLSAKDRFTALQSGEIDVLSRNTTWTLSRDTSLGLNFTGVSTTTTARASWCARRSR